MAKLRTTTGTSSPVHFVATLTSTVHGTELSTETLFQLNGCDQGYVVAACGMRSISSTQTCSAPAPHSLPSCESLCLNRHASVYEAFGTSPTSTESRTSISLSALTVEQHFWSGATPAIIV
ncbi:hypothetical protein CONLIGDRAFT_497294 [Coniochaeta ligniaria NRRL 30616]|uniref:Uncharacterized protein n=1 Tax=Coniochaeta ligniaria NRRL 30616 TaxID=1408157 RepID=A0A1J7I405_9PEZI|nr:hypothetical protein CONLIGDRAFT_497294 [Coniochaeta ligniaria NRRL 30616]